MDKCAFYNNILYLIIFFLAIVFVIPCSYAFTISSGGGYILNTSSTTTFLAGDIGFLGSQDYENDEDYSWIYANYKYAKISRAVNGVCSNYESGVYAMENWTYCLSLPNKIIILEITDIASRWTSINITVLYEYSKTLLNSSNNTIVLYGIVQRDNVSIISTRNASINIRNNTLNNVTINSRNNASINTSAAANRTNQTSQQPNNLSVPVQNNSINISNNSAAVDNNTLIPPQQEMPKDNPLAYILLSAFFLFGSVLLVFKLKNFSE